MLAVAEAERYRQTLQQLQATQQRLGYHSDWLIREGDFPSLRLGLVLSTYRWKASEEALLQYLSLGGNLLMLDATTVTTISNHLGELLNTQNVRREHCWIILRGTKDSAEKLAHELGVGWWDMVLDSDAKPSGKTNGVLPQNITWQTLKSGNISSWSSDLLLECLQGWPDAPFVTTATYKLFKENQQNLRDYLQALLLCELRINLLQQQVGSTSRFSLTNPLQKAMQIIQTLAEWNDYLVHSWYPVFQYQTRKLQQQNPQSLEQSKRLFNHFERELMGLMGLFEETLRQRHALLLANFLEKQQQKLTEDLPPDSQFIRWLVRQDHVQRLWLPVGHLDQLTARLGLMRQPLHVPLAAPV
ncbi:MAG: hypothetical protein VW829_04140 [Deltaproteobacteria bacterium]|jgi:hypothetical protein